MPLRRTLAQETSAITQSPLVAAVPGPPAPATLNDVEQLKQRLELIIETNDRRYAAKDQFQQDAVKLALQSNDKRLEAMNEFRGVLSDQSARMITRVESDALHLLIGDKADERFKALNLRIDSEIEPIHEKLAAFGRPNWMLLASMLSILLVMTAGVWLVIGLKIDASLSPIQIQMENLKVADATVADAQRFALASAAASTQADTLSRADRLQLNARLGILEAAVATLGASSHGAEERTAAQLIEIETQFKSASIVINIEKDETQRLFGMLWPKVFPGTSMPETKFRPNLSKDN